VFIFTMVSKCIYLYNRKNKRHIILSILYHLLSFHVDLPQFTTGHHDPLENSWNLNHFKGLTVFIYYYLSWKNSRGYLGLPFFPVIRSLQLKVLYAMKVQKYFIPLVRVYFLRFQNVYFEKQTNKKQKS
jgi:hypothetical protein